MLIVLAQAIGITPYARKHRLDRPMRKRISLAQNYFKDSRLVASTVRASSINKQDIVYEIGPGTGIITQVLAKIAKRVVVIEKDQNLVKKLRAKFRSLKTIEIHEADFLKYRIKHDEYKIFSNIPFNITSDIVRKILYGKNPPRETYLVIQKEAAEKFTGVPFETQFSILTKPWFSFSIIRKFKPTDFVPVPKVDVVLLHVEKRSKPLVSSENAPVYQRFVKHGFGAWRKHLKAAYKKTFTYVQWKKLARDLHFPLTATPTQLTFEQWLGLFNFYLENVQEKGEFTSDV
jgi:23S rRNA (adenine-N6)-dimethyltransferase